MKSCMKHICATLRLTFAAVALIAAATSATAADWQPSRPIELVNPAGAGGASDQMARLIAAIIQKNQLIKQPVIVQIKSGEGISE